MRYTTKQLQDILKDNVVEVEDLIHLLDISIEDVLERFPDFIKEQSDVIIANWPESPYEYEDEEL